MQSGPHAIDAITTPSEPTLPESAARASTAPQSGPAQPAPYTPRTVWQTPHGLAPTFTRPRSARAHDVARIVRRCLRVVYRMRRTAAATRSARAAAQAPQAHAAALALLA